MKNSILILTLILISTNVFAGSKKVILLDKIQGTPEKISGDAAVTYWPDNTFVLDCNTTNPTVVFENGVVVDNLNYGNEFTVGSMSKCKRIIRKIAAGKSYLLIDLRDLKVKDAVGVQVYGKISYPDYY